VSIERVVAHIRALPDDDPLLLKLANCVALDDPDAGFQLPPDAGQDIVHCGSKFKSLTAEECAAWFADWVEDVINLPPGRDVPEDV
jgi:hypothetical protein